MYSPKSTPRNRKRTLAFLGGSILLAGAAGVLGIDDNLPGVLAAFLSALALVLAVVHPWRRARQFGLLLIASLAGFVLLVLLDIVSASFFQNTDTSAVFQAALHRLAEAGFLLGAFLCPAAFIAAVVGLGVVFIRSLRRGRGAAEGVS